MRKGLCFKFFEEKFYKLTHVNALAMVQNIFGLVFA